MADARNGGKRNLIIVSNRLPLSVKQTDDGTYQSSISSGGLVTSLSGLTKSTTFKWFGWPGLQVDDPQDREKVSKSLAEHNAVAVFLDQKLANEHYNCFSNQILWPILHYQTVTLNENAWESYKKVNELFAEAVAKAASDGDLVWIHDYHLMLLPGLLRKRLEEQGKSCAIGFSLHTPFPAKDFWRALPVRKELIEGILASDQVGFHTDEYKQNFMDSCHSLLEATIEPPDKIRWKGRLIIADSFIVGIDPQKFEETLQKSEVISRIKELEEVYKDKKVIIGVDRLDYIKGLTLKLKAYDAFLDEHKELKNKVVLIQVAVPSREDVKEYQDLETEISTMVGKIDGKHATPDGSPLVYMHRSVPFTELTALYAIADACLLTSMRDGMNLVCFEYVACQAKKHGVLVLSEFAGASSFMNGGCITFHPANTKELSDAIYRAITMKPDERESNYNQLRRFIDKNTSARWGETFIERLAKCTA